MAIGNPKEFTGDAILRLEITARGVICVTLDGHLELSEGDPVHLYYSSDPEIDVYGVASAVAFFTSSYKTTIFELQPQT